MENEIVINAPLSKVWDALVNPEQTPKYKFGCKVGSVINWSAAVEGKETTMGLSVITKQLEKANY